MEQVQNCLNTYGGKGHVWRELIGGRQCEVCGEQEAIAYFEPAEMRLELLRLRVARPRFLVSTLTFPAA